MQEVAWLAGMIGCFGPQELPSDSYVMRRNQHRAWTRPSMVGDHVDLPAVAAACNKDGPFEESAWEVGKRRPIGILAQRVICKL